MKQLLPLRQSGAWSTVRTAVLFSGWIRRTWLRHLLVAILAVLLVYLFGLVHGHWDPMHRWNKATADASFLLLAFTMAIGPAARLNAHLRRLVVFRRECGIYAVLLALAHALIILDGWVVYDLAGLFGFVFHPDLGRYVMLQHGFGLANLVGIVALVYGFVLAATSNDRSLRLLGAPVWKFVQIGAYVLWGLVVLHTAYFLFMHFLSFHRALPPPNPLIWPFVALVGLVLGLRILATTATWRKRRRGDGAQAAGGTEAGNLPQRPIEASPGAVQG